MPAQMLPVELIDHIFSYLWGDIPALKACSTVHPLFSRLAERYLYADIIIKASNASDVYKQLSINPRILYYPRTLEIQDFSFFDPLSANLSIMSMIPRMVNLKTFELSSCSHLTNLYPEDLLSLFRNCLQRSSIEDLALYSLNNFPLSVLDNCKNIKTLFMGDCTAMEESISNSVPLDQSLETLTIDSEHNTALLFWTMGRASHLVSLHLCHGIAEGLTAFPELLMACSDSLRVLRLDVGIHCPSFFDSTDSHVGGQWTTIREYPFTISALRGLKELSIFAHMYLDPDEPSVDEVYCPLPAIMQLIKTAPNSIQTLDISLFCEFPDTNPLAQLDWSPLDCFQADFVGDHPPIELSVGGEDMHPESVIDALHRNKALMVMEERGVVIIRAMTGDWMD